MIPSEKCISKALSVKCPNLEIDTYLDCPMSCKEKTGVYGFK
jgi:hypothetical protein